MPWSEHKPGTDFQEWAQRVLGESEALRFIANPGGQQDEYVTAYPTRANSHPLLRWHHGLSEGLLPIEFKYNTGSCVKLVIRNVKAHTGFPPVVIDHPRMDKLWFAVQVADHCSYGPVSRDLKLRSHPDTLAKTFPTEALRDVSSQRPASLRWRRPLARSGRSWMGGLTRGSAVRPRWKRARTWSA